MKVKLTLEQKELLNDSFWLAYILRFIKKVDNIWLKSYISNFMLFFSSIYANEIIVANFGEMSPDITMTRSELNKMRINNIKLLPMENTENIKSKILDMGVDFNNYVFDMTVLCDNNLELFDTNYRMWEFQIKNEEKFDNLNAIVNTPLTWTKRFLGDYYESISNIIDELSDQYIKEIEKLLKDGYAYERGGNVYFDTSKLDKYYVLTNHEEENLLEGVRETVDVDTNKKNKTDFVLWFTKSKFDSQDLKWDSPFGTGYPGWHIECTGISIKYLGEYLDIHCGGVDNIFPHHTNEIAQSESFLGHHWCNYWVHGEHLNDESGKMSKSHGKTLTVDTLIEMGYNPLSYRFLCLQSHYRKQLTFSYNSLAGAETAYKKLKNRVLSLNKEGNVDSEVYDLYNRKFKECLEDDLNTANALTLVFEVLKLDTNESTKYKLISDFDKVLSLSITDSNETSFEDDTEILKKIEERNEAKKNKNFELADKIRNELLEIGIILKDTREGTTFERK